MDFISIFRVCEPFLLLLSISNTVSTLNLEIFMYFVIFACQRLIEWYIFRCASREMKIYCLCAKRKIPSRYQSQATLSQSAHLTFLQRLLSYFSKLRSEKYANIQVMDKEKGKSSGFVPRNIKVKQTDGSVEAKKNETASKKLKESEQNTIDPSSSSKQQGGVRHSSKSLSTRYSTFIPLSLEIRWF